MLINVLNWIVLKNLKHRKIDAVLERSLLVLAVVLAGTALTAARQPTTIITNTGLDAKVDRLDYKQETIDRRLNQIDQMQISERLAVLERISVEMHEKQKETKEWQNMVEGEIRNLLFWLVTSVVGIILAQIIQIRESRKHRRKPSQDDNLDE